MSSSVRQDGVRKASSRRTRGINTRTESNTNHTPTVRRKNGQHRDVEVRTQHKKPKPEVKEHNKTGVERVEKSKAISPSIPELFKNDAIDFTEIQRDYYAEAFILEGSITMCPILLNLRTNLEKLTIIEKHIQDALYLFEESKQVSQTRRPQQQQNTRRRVKVR